MFEQNSRSSRQPAQPPVHQQPTPQVPPRHTPANPRSVQQDASHLNAPSPDLNPRDPAADPCCGMGHAVKTVATKFASALGMNSAAQSDRQEHSQAAEDRTQEAPADPGRAGEAAQLARAATDPNHPQYLHLSSDMCWDAVKRCGVEAGAVGRNVDAQHGLVSHADSLVPDRAAVERLPAGMAIGFFEGERPVHVMLSVGDGHACGNKNDCIGGKLGGKPYGWESLDLKELTWDGNGGITAPGLHSPHRTLQVRARQLGT